MEIKEKIEVSFEAWLEEEKEKMDRIFPDLSSDQKHAMYLLLFNSYLSGAVFTQEIYSEKLKTVLDKLEAITSK
jgi:hypothetical protein